MIVSWSANLSTWAGPWLLACRFPELGRCLAFMVTSKHGWSSKKLALLTLHTSAHPARQRQINMLYAGVLPFPGGRLSSQSPPYLSSQHLQTFWIVALNFVQHWNNRWVVYGQLYSVCTFVLAEMWQNFPMSFASFLVRALLHSFNFHIVQCAREWMIAKPCAHYCGRGFPTQQLFSGWSMRIS